MTAVIYARYSSDNQKEESIDGQIRECKSYAERNGIIINRILTEHYPQKQITDLNFKK